MDSNFGREKNMFIITFGFRFTTTWQWNKISVNVMLKFDTEMHLKNYGLINTDVVLN